MAVQWIKLYTALPDNRKIKQIRKLPDGDSIALFWIFLLCLAGETNDAGQVYITKEVPYTDEMLAAAFDMDVNTVRLALRTFEQFGMIEVVDNFLLLSNWEKYQAADKLEHLREGTRRRVAAYRERQKELAAGRCNVTDRYIVTPCNATEKEKDKDIDKDIEKENIKEKKKTTAARFAPPTPAEVAEYCTAAAITIDAEAFCDYYTANGWRVGRQPMKDWKAAARNWARRDAADGRRGSTPAGTRKNTTGFSGTGYEPPEGATDGLDAFFAASLNRAKKGD